MSDSAKQAIDTINQIIKSLKVQAPLVAEALEDALHEIEDEINDLEKSQDLLTALEDAGVDNWDGYSIAIGAMNSNV